MNTARKETDVQTIFDRLECCKNVLFSSKSVKECFTLIAQKLVKELQMLVLMF